MSLNDNSMMYISRLAFLLKFTSTPNPNYYPDSLPKPSMGTPCPGRNIPILGRTLCCRGAASTSAVPANTSCLPQGTRALEESSLWPWAIGHLKMLLNSYWRQETSVQPCPCSVLTHRNLHLNCLMELSAKDYAPLLCCEINLAKLLA